MTFQSEGDVYISQLWSFFQLYGWYCIVGACVLVFVASKRREYNAYLSSNNRFLDSERKAELDAQRERARAAQQAKYTKLVEEKGEAKPKEQVKKKLSLKERLDYTPTTTAQGFQPSARRWGTDRRRRGGA